MISLLCPTRGRPDRAMQFLESVLLTQHAPNEIIFGLQSDDKELINYPVEIKDRAIVFDPRNTVYYWNEMAKVCKGDLITLIADDVIMRTPNWDLEFNKTFELFPDEIFLITTQDGRGTGYPPSNLPTPHPTITRKWYETLGYFIFPGLFHYYADTCNSKMARTLNRQVNLYDVTWEHIKAQDETRATMRTNKWAELDGVTFQQCQRHMETDMNLLKEQMIC